MGSDFLAGRVKGSIPTEKKIPKRSPQKAPLPKNFWGGEDSVSSSSKSYGTLELQDELNDLSTQLNDIIITAGESVARYGNAVNDSGETNIRSIEKQLNNSIMKFPAELQSRILAHAMSLLITNL